MAKLIAIENAWICAQISTEGAEMQSIVQKSTGRELLWQGNPDIWRKRAPWLFPVIGQLKGGIFRYNGAEYAHPMHGFASGSEFAIVAQAEDSVTLALTASEATRQVYPWNFELKICYRVEGEALKISCTVRCLDPVEMYFSFGAHPGFLCAPGDALCFDGATELMCQRLSADSHLLLPQAQPMPARFVLQEELFDDDAMLLRAPKGTGVTLRHADGSGVRFTYGSVPWVGVWTKARRGLNYVCVEPWYGVDDPVDATGDIAEKLDIVRLRAGDTFEMQLCIAPV